MKPESGMLKRHLRILNHQCVQCGKNLDPVEDKNWYTGNLKTHCMMCRIKNKYRKHMDDSALNDYLEQCGKDRDTRRRAMGCCIKCMKPLPQGADVDLCMICAMKQEAGIDGKKAAQSSRRMYGTCERCSWKLFHGGHWSCPSPAGTNPKDRNCLLFERERLKGEADEGTGSV